REELDERRHFAILADERVARRVHELLEVLHPRVAAAVRLLAVMSDQPALVDDRGYLLVKRAPPRLGIEPVDELQEIPERAGRALRQDVLGDHRGGGPPQARAGGARLVADG